VFFFIKNSVRPQFYDVNESKTFTLYEQCKSLTGFAGSTKEDGRWAFCSLKILLHIEFSANIRGLLCFTR